MPRKLDDSVFYRGNCATAHSYYFNPHGEAAPLRPTPVVASNREAATFPLTDYAFTG